MSPEKADIDGLAKFLGVEKYELSIEMTEIPRKQARFVKNVKYGIMLGRLLTCICWVGVFSILAFLFLPDHNMMLLLTGAMCLITPRAFSGLGFAKYHLENLKKMTWNFQPEKFRNSITSKPHASQFEKIGDRNNFANFQILSKKVLLV